MTKKTPAVRDFMTPQPYWIGVRSSLEDARRMMADHRVRHLPVLSGRKIFGILSDRDVKMAMGFVDSRPDHITIRQICRQKPYCVHPDTPLAVVAETMANRHIGCAIVQDRSKLAGIFTTVDACRALAGLLGVPQGRSTGRRRKKP